MGYVLELKIRQAKWAVKVGGVQPSHPTHTLPQQNKGAVKINSCITQMSKSRSYFIVVIHHRRSLTLGWVRRLPHTAVLFHRQTGNTCGESAPEQYSAATALYKPGLQS